MKLGDLPKYYSPKSPGLTNASVSTSEGALSIIDVITAQGTARNQAEAGFSTSLGKVGTSTNDRKRAAELLAEYALSQCGRVVALGKLLAEIKPTVVRIMASCVSEDYARSAVSKKQYSRCHGKKFIESEVLTDEIQYPDGKPSVWAKRTKSVYPSYREEQEKVREMVKTAYPECGGKGEVSIICKDCCGRSVTIRRKESVKRGMPVIRDCQRCDGRGCERLPPTEAFNAICKVTNAIMLDT